MFFYSSTLTLYTRLYFWHFNATGRECTIYVGVSSEGRVHGVKIGRKERDLLCVAIDGIMHNSFSPSIKHNRYKVYTVEPL